MIRKPLAQLVTFLMWLVIVAGVALIFLDAWRRIDARYASEGVVTEGLMMIIMGGIPSIAFAAIVNVAVNLLILRHLQPLAIAPPNAETKPVPTGETFAD